MLKEREKNETLEIRIIIIIKY